ncbi:MAG: putative Ig domain-containing protein [Pseudomonadota bacterium]
MRPSMFEKRIFHALALAAALALSACSSNTGEDVASSILPPDPTPPPTDTVAPTVDIVTPADDGRAETTQTTVAVTGRATDNVALKALTWNSSRGGNGDIPVSENWRSPDISLLNGDNVITVTAEDEAGNTNSDSITIVFRDSGDGSQDATGMISYNSDLSDPTLLTNATVSREFAYLFFEPGTRWNELGVDRVEFYCCKEAGAASGHLPRVTDRNAPFSLGIDLSQFEAGTRRELYIDVVYDDGSRGNQRVEFNLEQDSGTPPPANRAPTIGGAPNVNVTAGQNYSFIPTANDPDGDLLTFSVRNAPAWASFDTATGQLSGRPDAGDVGTYGNIRISVTDGEQTANLAPFTIEVTGVSSGSVELNWTPPSEREDGSALNGLSGYRIYYGTRSGVYENQIDVSNGGISSYTLENLASGTWYIAITSFDNAGLESELSNEVAKTAG